MSIIPSAWLEKNSKKIKMVSVALILTFLGGALPSSTAYTGLAGGVISNSPTTNSIAAGYFMTATMGTVNEVHTTVTVPKVTCTASESDRADYIVGLDNPPESREGAGISFGCNTGTPTYSGFYVIANAFHYVGTIHPGDNISATAEFSSSIGVTIILKDLTQGHSWSMTVTGTDPGATKTDFSWNLVLFPGPTLPKFGTLLTYADSAIVNNVLHYIGYLSVNSAITTQHVTMQTAPGHRLAYPSFVGGGDTSFNIIWVAST
ncbi:MAG: G1 family glutamic endopeptidase [Nitrososphaerales archaeon]